MDKMTDNLLKLCKILEILRNQDLKWMKILKSEFKKKWVGGGMAWEAGVSRCKLLYKEREWIKKVLLVHRALYSTSMTHHNEKKYLQKRKYICITESLCCTYV